MKRFVFVAFLQFGLCVPPTFVRVGIGGITTYPAGCDTVRALQCTADSSRSDFLRLTIYDTDNPNKTLVSMKMRSDTCQTGTQPASCVLNDDNTVTLTVVLTDLMQGETRRYGCEANYYNRVADKEISYTDVSVPMETWTSLTSTPPTSATSSYQTSRRHFMSTTDEKSPTKPTSSGWMTTIPIYDSDARAVKCTAHISRDDLVGLAIYDITSREEQLAAIKFPRNTCKTWTQPASSDINEDDETLTLTVVPTDLMQGETRRYRCVATYYRKDKRTEEFYTKFTLPSKETKVRVGVYVAGGVGVTVVVVVIIVICVVKRRRYLAWRARYAQVQRSPEQDMAFYRRLGVALPGDDDGNVEAEESLYQVVDVSQLRPDRGPRSSDNVHPRRRHCRAPPYRHQVPLPPLPSDGSRAVTYRRRPRSLPDDYLHPASPLSDRRAADNSTASRSHRRSSLPSDYLHPGATLPTP